PGSPTTWSGNWSGVSEGSCRSRREVAADGDSDGQRQERKPNLARHLYLAGDTVATVLALAGPGRARRGGSNGPSRFRAPAVPNPGHPVRSRPGQDQGGPG